MNCRARLLLRYVARGYSPSSTTTTTSSFRQHFLKPFSSMATQEPQEGARASVTFPVTSADLASAISPDPNDRFPKVFATARLVAIMEIASARVLEPSLGTGQLSVGVRIDATHSAPTPEGESVTAEATFTGKEGKLSFERTVSSRSSATPVQYGWEELLDQKIDILKEASLSGNKHLLSLSTIELQDRLDHVATFRREAMALSPHTYDSTHEIMQALEQHCLNASKDVKSDTDEVRSEMESRASKDADRDEWEQLLDEKIDMLKNRSAERWDDLRSFGKRRIRELPERLQTAAARAYIGGLNAVMQFVHNSVQWLGGAVDTVSQWYRQAWAKIKEWEYATKNWFEGAYNTIRGWFSAYIDRFGEPCSPRPNRTTTVPLHSAKGLPDLENITARLEKVGLDRFLLVKKGDEWVVQLSL
ncbi:uncharacterized protein LTHEOB_4580 [Lasiodiplodia theobromae]|uniref:uncharacterized protein n=1 Tax=Lasiodiplodia theobromae TaxID=45133 RepID=UPI0015C31304|nr:uncharacterized protein LTHEOB_4580 [Lasiodiplodia theobromae]KAF4545928.1 hypothetical protein LTHEOB_4580 [Lasiodiplodia theobromae]